MRAPARIALVVRLAAIAIAGTAVGCTLFSGWSDLQDGHASADAGADGHAGGSSGSSGSPGSSSSSGSGGSSGSSSGTSSGGDSGGSSSTDTTVACGSARCDAGLGCCLAVLGGGTCESSSQSCAPPGIFMSCSDSSACTAELGHSAQCCASTTSGIPTVSCRTTCASGDQVVCDPTAETPGCAPGQACSPDPDGFAYNTCQ